MKSSRIGVSSSDCIQLPAPTAWPLVLACGVALAALGLVTSALVSFLGGALVLAGSLGWFAQVLPHEAQVRVPVENVRFIASTARPQVQHFRLDLPHRAVLPVEIYPIRAGVAGGIAGGIAMVIPALVYGWAAQRSIWFAVNLLGGAGVAHWRNPSAADIATFHWNGLIVAAAIHAVTSIVVGLLYGAMLPMLPRRPILLGGIVAPLLWSGLLHSTLTLINPALAAHISWAWFLVSQLVYGIVAGLVVARAERIKSISSLPAIVRVGLETPGLIPHSRSEDER